MPRGYIGEQCWRANFCKSNKESVSRRMKRFKLALALAVKSSFRAAVAGSNGDGMKGSMNGISVLLKGISRNNRIVYEG